MTNSRPSRSHSMSEATLYEVLKEIETRLGDKLDAGLKEMKDLYRENRRATEDVGRELDRHEALPGHPVLENRVHTIEVWKDGQTQQGQQRPMQMFQIGYSLLYLGLSAVSIIFSLIALLHR